MSIKSAVLERLKQASGGFVSGEEIAASLGVTRAAVWKAVRELTADGIGITAVRNQGYQLSDADQTRAMNALLSPERIKACLTGSDVPEKLRIDVRRCVDSTNRVVREQEDGSGEDALAVAAAQTAGRGRMGRCFFSPEGSGLYMSLLLHPKLEARESVLITTAAAVAAARAVDSLTGDPELPCRIKWVNDLYLREKKISGILTEAQLNVETARLDFAVLGIGFNVITPEGGFPAEIADRAGAIFAPGDEIPDDIFNRLAAAVTSEFYRLYLPLNADVSAKSAFLDEYRRRGFVVGREVTVVRADESYPAVAEAIDDDFRLLVRRRDGTLEPLSSGEVTLKL